MNRTPLQLVNFANDHCGRDAVIVSPASDRMALRVAAASFAETYSCPDPTCRPDIRLSANEGITSVTVVHDDWCAELRRRSIRARRRKRAKR